MLLMVDWNKHAQAVRLSRDGDPAQALSILDELMQEAETEQDKCAILLGQASCYSRKWELDKSLELILQAKEHAGVSRDLLLQVARVEASIHACKRQSDLACKEYTSLKAEYRDLLERDEDSAVDVDSRFACTLVDAGRYRESIPIFKKLLQRDGLEDLQRIQLYLGIALVNSDAVAEGQQLLFSAAKGSDASLAESALEHITALKQAQ
jgi:tetratricopeptide (TPR) repeat protein